MVNVPIGHILTVVQEHVPSDTGIDRFQLSLAIQKTLEAYYKEVDEAYERVQNTKS